MVPNLTPEQSQALASAKNCPIRLVDPESHQSYFLIKAEVFERFQSLLTEDTVYTTAEVLDRTMAQDDVADPYLAELQRKYGGQ